MLPAALRDELPTEVVDYFDLGHLFAGEVNGLLTWIVIRLGEIWYGDLVGPLFTESVLSGWQRYDPTQYVPPIA